MKPMLASPAGPVIPFPMLLSPKLGGIAKAVYHGSKGENGMKNIDDEILFKLVKDHLNKIYHKRKDKIIHAGTGLTQPAQWYRDFAQAVIDVALKDLVMDAERLDWLIEQGCSHGVVYEGLDKSFWMVWLDGHDAHKDKHQISRYHTAREAIDAAKGFPAAKENK